VIACIALFVAMGGVSYAVSAGSIDSRAVKDGSIRNKDFKDGTLRGQEAKRNGFGGGAIKESSLEKVPSAAAADSVDGKNAAGLVTRWALVNENGDIEEQSGGFTVVSKPGINGQPTTNPNVYISAGSSLVGKGLNVSTAIQNRIDRNGDATADPAFNGDTAVGRCNTAAINCVPAGTNADNVLVVRSLVDNTDATTQTRRFYVEVSE
jgi:hypothetical protein